MWIATRNSKLRKGINKKQNHKTEHQNKQIKKTREKKGKEKRKIKRKKKAKFGALTDPDENRNTHTQKATAVKNSSNRDKRTPCRPHAVSSLKDVTAPASFATVIFLQERRA